MLRFRCDHVANTLSVATNRNSGIAAVGRLAHRATPYGASLSFATTTHLWPSSDPPSRGLRSATCRTEAARSIPGRALASSMSGSLCQGPGPGLPPPISTSVLSTPSRPGRRPGLLSRARGALVTRWDSQASLDWKQSRPRSRRHDRFARTARVLGLGPRDIACG